MQQADARPAGKPQSLFKRVSNGALREAAFSRLPGLGPSPAKSHRLSHSGAVSPGRRPWALGLGSRGGLGASSRGSCSLRHAGRQSELPFKSQQTGAFWAGDEQAPPGRRGCPDRHGRTRAPPPPWSWAGVTGGFVLNRQNSGGLLGTPRSKRSPLYDDAKSGTYSALPVTSPGFFALPPTPVLPLSPEPCVPGGGTAPSPPFPQRGTLSSPGCRAQRPSPSPDGCKRDKAGRRQTATGSSGLSPPAAASICGSGAGGQGGCSGSHLCRASGLHLGNTSGFHRSRTAFVRSSQPCLKTNSPALAL